MTTYTINTIRDEMQADGSHWWDKSNMRFFRCRVSEQVYQGSGGVYFVTSEKYNDTTPRKYSVRKYDPATKDVETVGEFNSMTRQQAHRLAAESAGESAIVAAEAYKPQTEAEQLALDIRRGGGSASRRQAERLIYLANRHQKIMVDYCNGIDPYGDDGEPGRPLASLQKRIVDMATECGCKGVRLGGDPRGCTVKLVLPNGETNDWGEEGWCVPTRD